MNVHKTLKKNGIREENLKLERKIANLEDRTEKTKKNNNDELDSRQIKNAARE